MKRFCIALAMLALSTVSLRAQHATSGLSVGNRVRVEACEQSGLSRSVRVRRYVGDVLHSDSSMVVLRTAPTRPDTVSTALITIAWGSVGRRSRLATSLRGFLLGAAAGSLLGFGLDAMHANQSGDGSGEAFESILLPFFGATIGASIGVLVGYASGGEQWRHIPLSTDTNAGCLGRRTRR